jgi:hypothetical protein
MIILLGLAASLAPLGRGIAALAEKGLIGSSECKFLSAVTAGELQVPSHNRLLSLIRSVWRVPALFLNLPGTLEEIDRKSEQRFGSLLIIAPFGHIRIFNYMEASVCRMPSL